MITKCVLKLVKDRRTGWYLDITVSIPGQFPKNYHSLVGETTIEGANFNDVKSFYFASGNGDQVPASSSLRAERQEKISRLLLPANWQRIKDGCQTKSNRTLQWLETYLGISASAMNDDDLEIPV